MHRTLSGRILFGFFAIAIFVQDSVADEYTFTSEKGLSVTRQLEDGVKCDFRNGKTTPYYRERYKVSGHAPRKLAIFIHYNPDKKVADLEAGESVVHKDSDKVEVFEGVDTAGNHALVGMNKYGNDYIFVYHGSEASGEPDAVQDNDANPVTACNERETCTPLPINESKDKVMTKITFYAQENDVTEEGQPIYYDAIDVDLPPRLCSADGAITLSEVESTRLARMRDPPSTSSDKAGPSASSWSTAQRF